MSAQASEIGSGPEGAIFLSRERYNRETQALLLGRGPVALALQDVSESDVLEFMLGAQAELDMRANLTRRFRPDIWGQI